MQRGYTHFEQTFFENNAKRSRTVRGSGMTDVSPLKLPLLVSGEERSRQLDLNFDRVIKSTWRSAHEVIGISTLRLLFRDWIESLSEGLVDLKGYTKLRKEHGLTSPNPYYRLWEISYHKNNPKPTEIEVRLNLFMQALCARIESPQSLRVPETLADVLSFADREIDLIIHPWLDGCGRFATTLLMWIALRSGTGLLPHFRAREDHYEAMEKSAEAHSAYLRLCLR